MTDKSTGRTVVYVSPINKKKTTVEKPSEPEEIPDTADDSTVGYALIYRERGDPSVVLHKEKFLIPTELKNEEVLVQILASPINPSDCLSVLGLYAIKPPLPATGGFEGIGKVLKVGSDVTEVEAGDWVIQEKGEGVGMWRTHAVWNGKNLRKIPNDIPVLAAATIAVNPPTAYRMLLDFVQLQPGDAVIQNGANSGVGEAVIQIARHLEFVTINVVRSRPDLEDLKQHLTKLGADYVVTEEELRSEEFRNSLPTKPKLALDCVGGQSASDLLDALAPKGTMVTYGAMSNQPVMVSSPNLIFKDVTVKGFWVSKWKKENFQSPEADKMFDHLCQLIREGKLASPQFEEVGLGDYERAMQKAMSGFKGIKMIFVMDNPSDLANSRPADVW